MVSVKNLDTILNIFSENIEIFKSIFPLEPNFFLLQNHTFQTFLVLKSSVGPGGGVKALGDASAKNAILFYVLSNYVELAINNKFLGVYCCGPT